MVRRATSRWRRLSTALRRRFVPLADQGVYLAHTAAGQEAVVQLLWLYRRPVDLDAIRRFQSNLARGLLARLIRPALLPFCRHQWTSVPPSSGELAIAGEVLSPDALRQWSEDQVQLPLDPALGPGWNLTVQPFSDGSTAVSLVVSHCIADGTAIAMAVSEATRGERRQPEYPPIGAPRRATWPLLEIARFLLDLPALARALFTLAMSAVRTLPTLFAGAARPSPAPATAPPSGRSARPVALASVSMRIEAAAWHARARSLGVNRFTLLTAVTAAFAEGLARSRNGEVLLVVPINQRAEGADVGGNQVSLARLRIDVEVLKGPLRALQQTVQSALLQARNGPDDLTALLPLIPFVPRRLFASVAGAAAHGASGDLPVTCSHMGTLPTEMLWIDGGAADRFCFHGVDRNLSAGAIERRRGVATLLAGFIPGYLLLNFVAYQPGVATDTRQLRAVVDGLLGNFDLSGEAFDD